MEGELPRLSPEGIALLKTLLCYVPEERVHADVAIQSPYFASL